MKMTMKIFLTAIFIFFFQFVLPPSVFATDSILRWGADIESGAPFAFKNPNNLNQIIGFEAEIVDALAKELQLQPQFVQNSWDGLVEGLKRKDYDIVINGLEITPDRAEVVNFTVPYYITSEILAVRKETYTLNSLADLTGKRVGTLDGSLAFRILQEQKGIEIVPYDEEIHAYNDLADQRLDAVLLDEPIHLYYAQANPKLKKGGGPIGYMEYGIAVRKDDTEFFNRVNTAIKKLIANGTLRAIHERWALWNELTAKAWAVSPTPQSEPVAYNEYLEATGQAKTWRDKLKQYVSFLPVLGKGALMTLNISIVSMVLAIAVGLLIALMRLYGPAPFSFLALSFVELFRGTPLLIQLYLIFYGLPHLGIRLDPFTAAVIGLGLNYGACEAENYRAGILSIPKAQMDAAFALGMTRRQSLRHVIVPQAMRLVIPPVTNDFIALLKDSSLVSVITMVELTTMYGQLASTYFDYLGIGLLTAAVYFVIGLPFVRLARHFEARLARETKRKTRAAVA
jgi:polar amino acid transport system substrate-binding protein